MFRFLKSRDIHCTAGAALFVLGGFLSFVYRIALARQVSKLEDESISSFGDLGTMQLIDTWSARLTLQWLLSTSIVINACAWVAFAIAIIKLTWVLSSKGTYSLGSTVTIAILAVGGALTEFLASLLYLGANRAMLDITSRYELNSWISRGGPVIDLGDIVVTFAPTLAPFTSAPAPSPALAPVTAAPLPSPSTSGNATIGGNVTDQTPQSNLTYSEDHDRLLVDNFDSVDDQYDMKVDNDDYYLDGDITNDKYDSDGLGWKSLELFHAVSNGLVSFIDAIEYLFLSVVLIMTFVAVLNKGSREFSLWWASFGLLVALVSLAQFLTTVVALSSWSPLLPFSTALVFINNFLLLPIWVFWLGQPLKEAQSKMYAAANRAAARQNHNQTGASS